MSRLIDLSHPLGAATPPYPGDGPTVVTAAAAIRREGYRSTRLELCTHAGTHLDAPSHVLDGAPSLDELPPEAFFGRGIVLDLGLLRPKAAIGESLLAPHAAAAGGADFILVNTGWSSRWGTETYFIDHPFLTPDGAAWLAAFPLKGVGLDTPSPDRPGARDFPVHRLLLGRGAVIIENLADPGRAAGAPFTLACFPLRLAGGEASPVRAVAILRTP